MHLIDPLNQPSHRTLSTHPINPPYHPSHHPSGISLNNALSVTTLMNWAVRNGAETESIMNSVERVLYTTLQTPQVQYSTIQYIPTPQVCYVPSAIYLLLCPLGYIYPVLYPLCYVLLLCAPLLLYTMFYIPYLMSPGYILAHSSLPSPTVSSLQLFPTPPPPPPRSVPASWTISRPAPTTSPTPPTATNTTLSATRSHKD